MAKCGECGKEHGHHTWCDEFGLGATDNKNDRRAVALARRKRHPSSKAYKPLSVPEDDPMAMVLNALHYVPRIK